MTSDLDRALLDQFVRTQDPVAFDQLARRYRSMVFSVARRVTQSHHDAEDVAQNCFLELAKKAASIRVSVPAFLHSTATRRSIDLLRDKHRRRKYETQAVIDLPKQPVQIPSEERAWDEIAPEVDQAIDHLPEDLKPFVILYFLRGLSVPDIALETGLKRGTVERRLQVGVRRLRADLAKGNRVVSAGVLAIGLKASSMATAPPSLTAATGRMALAAASHFSVGARPRPSFYRQPKWLVWLIPTCAGLVTFWLITVNFMHRSANAPRATPYDEINRMYAAYLPIGESSRLALRTTEIKSDPYSFWRGSQTLFYQWCKSHCADWLADSNSYVLCHGSANLEDSWRLAQFKNPDDSARLPVQIELLQGMILAKVATGESPTNSTMDSSQLAEAICQTYKASLGQHPPEAQVSVDHIEFLGADRYTDTMGRLRPLITNHHGKLVAFLRPSPLDADKVERLLADALSRNPQLQSLCGSSQPRVRDVRLCVRQDSLISDGGLVLVVQLQGSGTLLELKQQTPAPAELADLVPREQRSPGQRAAEDAEALSPSGNAAMGWCDWASESFTVASLSQYPQICQLNQEHFQDPILAGRAWAAATAATHRNDPRCAVLSAKITPQLQAELIERCQAYMEVMHNDLQQFNSDWRVARDRANTNALSAAWSEQIKPSEK